MFKDTHLDIDTLDVEHESASLRADADVTFENDYPLNLQANAAISLDENTRQKLDLSASGSLSDLSPRSLRICRCRSVDFCCLPVCRLSSPGLRRRG